MNQLVVADRDFRMAQLKSLVLDSVSSPVTRRVYNPGLDVHQRVVWAGTATGRVHQSDGHGLACGARSRSGPRPISINVRITAVRKRLIAIQQARPNQLR